MWDLLINRKSKIENLRDEAFSILNQKYENLCSWLIASLESQQRFCRLSLKQSQIQKAQPDLFIDLLRRSGLIKKFGKSVNPGQFLKFAFGILPRSIAGKAALIKLNLGG